MEENMKITTIELTNFKSIKHIVVNFAGGHNIKKIAAIYGENGAGKSTIIDAFKNLCLSIRTLDNLNNFIKFRDKIMSQIEDTPMDTNDFLQKSKLQMLTNLKDVFKNCHTINEQENTMMKFFFSLNGKVGYYQLSFSDKNELIEEKLYHVKNKNRGILFDIKKDKKTVISSEIIKDHNLRAEIENMLSRFWGQHSLLAIIASELNNYNNDFIKDNVQHNILAFINGIGKITLYQNSLSSQIILSSSQLPGKNIEGGEIPLENEKYLTGLEGMLNAVFTAAYSDVIKVFYDVTKSNKSINYKLIFQKRIAGRPTNIPINLESGGTRRLIQIVPLLIEAIRGNVVIIDEIDNGIHDLLMILILKALANNIHGQLIFTTHNTQLMNALRSKNVFILNSDNEGEKEVYSLDEFGIRSSNNMSKMYLEGKFDGVPYPDETAMDVIMGELAQSQYGKKKED